MREIARPRGISRNTIQSYLRERIAEPAFQTSDRASKLDPSANQLTVRLGRHGSEARPNEDRSRQGRHWQNV